MDPQSTAALAVLVKGLAPVLGALIVLGMPAFIVFIVKHFKLRHRELELEAELHGKQTQTRLASIEARLGTLESAIGALARGGTQDRNALMEPPATSEDVPAAARDPQSTRTR